MQRVGHWVVWCVVVAIVAIAVLGADARPTSSEAPGDLIVMGDSISVGCCAPLADTWPTILATRLTTKLVNVAVGGETSDSLINQPRDWPSGRTQPQLDEALTRIAESPRVAAVTLGIGTNDFFRHFNLRDPESNRLCRLDPTPACEALKHSAEKSFQANVRLILDTLAAALEPGTPVLVMTAYIGGNPWVNAAIIDEVNRHDFLLVDVAAYFAAGDLSELLISDGIHKGTLGHRVIADVFTNMIPPDSDGDGLSDLMEGVLGTDMYASDSDGDGCSDGAEFGPLADYGGQRHPGTFWDFYDTPDQSNNRDGTINIAGDLMRVLRRFGAHDQRGYAAVNRNTDPLSAPPPAPAYHPAFDRSRPASGTRWQLAGPDGIISLQDLLALIAQLGHRCE